MPRLYFACLGALALAAAAPPPAKETCGADGCRGKEAQPEEDMGLLQMGLPSAGAAALNPTDPADDFGGLLENLADPGIATLLQQEAQALSHPSSEEMEHFRLVKALRRRGYRCPNGKYFRPHYGEFKWDCRLWRAGRLWATRMALEGFVNHSHAGSTSCTRTEAQGFPRNRGCGENIGAGADTPQATVAQLQASVHHCLNMMEPKFNKLGVGFYYRKQSKYQYYWDDSFGDWHHGPDQVCIGGQPAPTPAPGCADIDTMNCQTYKDQGFCQYSPNVQAQCKETCGIGHCGQHSHAPAPAPAPTSHCADKDGACQFYAEHGYCSNNHIKQTCRSSCRLCSNGCTDTDAHCVGYRNLGYCRDTKVQAVCSRTCGLCRGGAQGASLGQTEAKEVPEGLEVGAADEAQTDIEGAVVPDEDEDDLIEAFAEEAFRDAEGKAASDPHAEAALDSDVHGDQCIDTGVNCGWWTYMNYCSHSWNVRRTCRKSCNMCAN